MSDPQEQASAEEAVETEDARTSNEIARSMGTVWTRYSGQRPKSTNVELGQHTVKCVIEEGTPDADANGEADPPADPNLSTDSAGFGYSATAAVARVTGRKVIGFIPKRDKKTEISTQTFVLDRPRRRY
jgi:hypothetical protein